MYVLKKESHSTNEKYHTKKTLSMKQFTFNNATPPVFVETIRTPTKGVLFLRKLFCMFYER